MVSLHVAAEYPSPSKHEGEPVVDPVQATVKRRQDVFLFTAQRHRHQVVSPKAPESGCFSASTMCMAPLIHSEIFLFFSFFCDHAHSLAVSKSKKVKSHSN